jgi:hypothetical protein
MQNMGFVAKSNTFCPKRNIASRAKQVTFSPKTTPTQSSKKQRNN